LNGYIASQVICFEALRLCDTFGDREHHAGIRSTVVKSPLDDRLLEASVFGFRLSERVTPGEIGYVFHPDAGGRGYAREACAAVLALGFAELGLHRIVARLDGRNEASARLASRLGLRKEAHLVSNRMFKGEWSDEIVFAILADEWPGSPAHRIRHPDGASAANSAATARPAAGVTAAAAPSPTP